MGFVVTYRGDLSYSQYRFYLLFLNRQLFRQGVGLDRVPRTRSNGYVFYVHNTRDDAVEIAKELNESYEEDGWEVAPVEGPTDVGPLQPLTLRLGRQEGSLGIGIERHIARTLRMRYPNSVPHDSIWVKTEQKQAYTPDGIRELVPQILPLLTGLSLTQLSIFGGFEVIDPSKDEIVVPFTPFASGDVAPQAATPTHCETPTSLAHCTPAPLG